MIKTIRKILGLAGAAAAIAGCVVTAPLPVKAQPAMIAAAAEAPQVKDDLFAGTEKFAQGASKVTEVNMDKNTLGMVGKNKGKDGDADLAHRMDFMVVHSYEYDKPGMYRMEDVEAYRRKLTDGSWNCFIHTRDKDGSTDICTRTVGSETNEMVVMTAEAKELTFVHMRGHGLSMGDIAQTGYMGRKKLPTPPETPLPSRGSGATPPKAPQPPQ